MKRTLAILALAALALTGCAAQPAPAPEPAPVAAETPTAEERARSTAISMDPIFSDDALWLTTLDVAQAYCAMADEVGHEAAFAIMVGQAVDAGVSGDQLGIIVGVAWEVYCPEHRQ